MPYNGIKAEAARKRLANAILNAQSVKRQTSTPLEGAYPITSGFGERIHPVTGERKMHTGVDYGAPSGTPVYATEDGYVSQAAPDAIRGNNVTVTAPGYGESRYEHLSYLSPQSLKGGWFSKGDLIGLSGNTGRTTGPHLHYGTFDKQGNAVDPLKLQQRAVLLAGT